MLQIKSGWNHSDQAVDGRPTSQAVQFMSSPALRSRGGTQRPPASSCTVSGTPRPFCPLSAGLCLLCTSSCSRPAVDSNKESKCLADSSSTQQKHLTFFFFFFFFVGGGGGGWRGGGRGRGWNCHDINKLSTIIQMLPFKCIRDQCTTVDVAHIAGVLSFTK